MFDFNKMPYIYWSDKEKVEFLQRYILVHSTLYYEMNESVISDKEYDSVAKQLYVMMKEQGVLKSKITHYYYVFKDFVPDTGFDLYHKLNYYDKNIIKRICRNVLKSYKGNKNV